MSLAGCLVGVNRQTGLEPHNIAVTMGCILQVSRGNFVSVSHFKL